MLEINWSDVINVLTQIQYHLIAIAAAIVVGVVIMVLCKKLPVAKKKLIRGNALLGMLLVIVIVANLICTGPMYSVLALTDPTADGALSEETIAAAREAAEEVAAEGIVLLKNEDNILPLSNKNLNVFGWASTNPCYGGTGSGGLNRQYETVDLLTGLANAGVVTNTELSTFYTNYRAERPGVGMWSQDWTLPEPPANTYSNSMIVNAQAHSDTAMIVLTRVGGEHIDPPVDVSVVNYTNNSEEYEDFPVGTHYLQPSQSEINMIELVCENFENVIFVYNGANTLQMGWIKNYPQIKGVIWCPGTGQNGFDALGKILTGEVNPSGKAADTMVADLTHTPTWNNFGKFEYDNMEEFRVAETDPYVASMVPRFVNYVEGIYVGYKFWETAADEGLIVYEDEVVYPFGHGLSYTTFTQDMGQISESNGTISFTVTVTNTGSVAGKEVVQVYFNPPYTNGGIEKATANLVAFDKTGVIAPGASETLTISFKVEDLASYDTYGHGCYVVEKGEYEISINSDSHNVIESQVYTVAEGIVYGEGNARSTDDTAATNQFAFAEGDVTYLFRKDGFANYEEATAPVSVFSMSAESKATFLNNNNWEIVEDPNAVMPTTGADNGMSLVELRGADYDDPRWETLLDQMSIDDMVNLIGLSGYSTPAIESIGKVQTVDNDGPAAINNNFTRVGSIGFPCAVVIANTWNEDLAYLFGDHIGIMANEMGTTGWYAPAMNMHRSAFGGRNFEYYSEDGLLSGKMAAQSTKAAMEHGVYAYIKHFALNDQEEGRWNQLCTWSTEQAIREIYLKPFELAVKDGGTTAVMSSYNYIGNQWAGSCAELLTNVLRNEWGFQGMVLTDYFANFEYMDATRMIYSGGDNCLAVFDTGSNLIQDRSATTVSLMRNACHNVLFAIVNSRAYSDEVLNPGLMVWQQILIAVDVLLAVVFVLLEVKLIQNYRKRAKAAA